MGLLWRRKRSKDVVEIFSHRLSGSEDGCPIFLAVVRVPVVNIVLQLSRKLMDLVGLAGQRMHVGTPEVLDSVPELAQPLRG